MLIFEIPLLILIGYSNSVEETESGGLGYSQYSKYRKEAVSLSLYFFDG